MEWSIQHCYELGVPSSYITIHTTDKELYLRLKYLFLEEITYAE